jgi:hypothetical protein
MLAASWWHFLPVPPPDFLAPSVKSNMRAMQATVIAALTAHSLPPSHKQTPVSSTFDSFCYLFESLPNLMSLGGNIMFWAPCRAVQLYKYAPLHS